MPSSSSMSCFRRCAMCAWAVVLVLVLALGCASPVQASVDCTTVVVCKPYEKSGPACKRNGRMNLRFMLETAREVNFTVSSTVHHLATYGFCPVVDDLAAFTLTGAPFLATSYTTTNATTSVVTDHLSMNMSHRYLSVYGFGASNSTAYPQTNFSSGTVVVAMNGTAVTSQYASVGVVTMLSLTIGMHNGLFNYIGATSGSKTTVANPDYNATLCKNTTTGDSSVDYCDEEITKTVAATVVQPAMARFVPTCNSKDVCMMGDSSVYTCIGDTVGQKNCGVYMTNATAIRGLQLTVWVSYYGTDSKQVVLKSGGTSPLNYMSFTGNTGLAALGTKLNSFVHGNFSGVTS